ncbi:MAG: protein translocase subunit SecF [Ignavibacteriaceae bacterium]|nr:protein translocase subunit SecF [Ignavibacteriaceae bacterium]
MRIFKNLNVDWLGKRKTFYTVSLIIFLAGVLSILFRGMQFGIDFKGGSEIVFQFDKPIDITKMRDAMSKTELGNVEVKTFGAETGVLVRTELQSIPAEVRPKVTANVNAAVKDAVKGGNYKLVRDSANAAVYSFDSTVSASDVVDYLIARGYQASRMEEANNSSLVIVSIGIADWIKETIKANNKDNNFVVLREDRVGPKIGEELKLQALLAVVISLLGILIYLSFRFKWIFAVGAVIALFHDVLITVGLYSILYGVIPGLNLEVDLTVIAAFLTLVGYSINDTVIVFDRVRETIKVHKSGKLIDLMNEAINKTMSRTILTGGTTLLAVFILLLFGGEVLRAFSFTLFFGIIIGTYSSIFVASALVLDYAARSKKKIEF